MNDKHVIVFDGVCNLCSWSVKFIIRRDYKNLFLFSPLQSVSGSQLLKNHEIKFAQQETILLIKDGKAYTQSDAVFEIIAEFNPLWRALGVFRFVPKPFRDYVYRVIAKNRYRLFGRKEQCMVPSPEVKAKFLD